MSLDVSDIETGASMLSRDESDECLLIGLVVSGMKVARARSGLHNGTGELLDVKRCPLVEVGARRVQNLVACQEGGTPLIRFLPLLVDQRSTRWRDWISPPHPAGLTAPMTSSSRNNTTCSPPTSTVP